MSEAWIAKPMPIEIVFDENIKAMVPIAYTTNDTLVIFFLLIFPTMNVEIKVDAPNTIIDVEPEMKN